MIKIKIDEVMRNKLPNNIEGLTVKFLERNLEEKAKPFINILIFNIKMAKPNFKTKAVAKTYFTRKVFSPKVIFIEENLNYARSRVMDNRVKFNEKLFTSFIYFHEIGHYVYFLNNFYSYSNELENPLKVIKGNSSKRNLLIEQYVDSLSFKFLQEENFFNLVDDISGDLRGDIYNNCGEEKLIFECFLSSSEYFSLSIRDKLSYQLEGDELEKSLKEEEIKYLKETFSA